MPLTLNQFLFLVLTIAAVVAVTFLVLVLHQVRKTAAEAQKALAEYRELARNLQALELTVRERVEDLGQVLEAAKTVTSVVAEAAGLLSSRAIKPAVKYWPLLFPIVRSLWQSWKKRKEEKDGRK